MQCLEGRIRMSKNVKQTVEEMVSPILEEMNLELVEIEYVKKEKIGFYVCLSTLIPAWISKTAEQ